MATTDPNFRRDVLRITAWTAVFPALALWPFLSALPVFTLLGGAGGAWAVTVQIVLLATGFWGVAPLAAAGWILLSDAERARRSANRGKKGLLVGCYATAWTIVYMIAFFAGR